MAKTAAHIQENIIGQLPVRQWVVSFPKRIRHYLQTDSILQKVLRVVANEIRKKVIACSPDAYNPEFGAISFIQRFGNTLNFHPQFILLSQMVCLKKVEKLSLFMKPLLHCNRQRTPSSNC
jgi:hypothetical protein